MDAVQLIRRWVVAATIALAVAVLVLPVAAQRIDGGVRINGVTSQPVGTLLFGNGLITAPSIAFAAEPTTGWFRAGTGDVRLVESGTLAVTIAAGVLTTADNIISGSRFYAGGAARAYASSPANGQWNFSNNAGTAGAGLDFSTDAVLKIRTAAQSAYATIDALAYQTSGVAGVGFAASTAQPADQTGNGTSTLKMNGLGAAGAPCTITPTSTGRVLFRVDGDLTNSVILDGISYKLVYGTGAAPANAAAAAGTAVSALRSPAVPVAAQKQGFSVTGLATGLALATATWYDLQIADVTGGTASVSNITCTANEI